MAVRSRNGLSATIQIDPLLTEGLYFFQATDQEINGLYVSGEIEIKLFPDRIKA